MSKPSDPCASCPDLVLTRGGSRAAGVQCEPAQYPLDIPFEEGIEPFVSAASTIGREKDFRPPMQELYDSLKVERRQIGA